MNFQDYLLAFAVDRHGADIDSVGLPMESLHTVLGLKYSGYFLTFCKSLNPSDSHHSHLPDFFHSFKGIIVNVSAAFTSFELMPRFYLYGYGLPFYNSVSCVLLGGVRKKEY